MRHAIANAQCIGALPHRRACRLPPPPGTTSGPYPSSPNCRPSPSRILPLAAAAPRSTRACPHHRVSARLQRHTRAAPPRTGGAAPVLFLFPFTRPAPTPGAAPLHIGPSALPVHRFRPSTLRRSSALRRSSPPGADETRFPSAAPPLSKAPAPAGGAGAGGRNGIWRAA